DLVFDGDDAVVDLGADHPVADGRVDRIGEVDDGGPGRQVDDIPAGGEGEDFLGQKVGFDVAEQVGGVGAGALTFQQLAHPGQPLFQPLVAARDAGLILPVGRDAVFGHAVHVPGADLHLEGDGLPADHGGVQALVAVGLGGGDIVLEAVGQRVVHIMDKAQRGVA